MLKRLGLTVGVAVAVLTVTGVLFSTVLAAGPGPRVGNGAAIGGRDIPLAVAADLTGLTEEQLLAELDGGKTIPVLLEEKGIDLTVFEQVVADARETAVEEAVAAGTISQGRAQVMLQRAEERQAAGEQGPHGPQAGAGHGEPSEGTGPDQSHRYGR
jgi:hypothetical protein